MATPRRDWTPFFVLHILLAFYTALAAAVSSQQPLASAKKASYSLGQAIPLSCLNRTIDTGEHIVDSLGRLQYIPFPTCNETGRPLELYFGIEREINCTIDFVSDSFFHLLEFYVHNDAPLTCRIPSRPLLSDSPTLADPNDEVAPGEEVGVMGTQSTDYTPMIVALTGMLQLSHLHVSNNLNVLLHAAPRSVSSGVIDAATAYSVSHATRNIKVVIGDPLPLRFSVRWYPTTNLPSGWTGVGGHLFLSTLVYCLLSAGAATAICVAYFRGVELPRRLRSHGRERTFGAEVGAAGRYNGYGYGVA
ncbi:hypothetical protein LTR16_005573, partial [Cryomyces antarcticus]